MVKVLNETQTEWSYEKDKLKYFVPKSDHIYTPDFRLENGIFIEGKGILSDYAERQKYILIKEQYPCIDLRFIFGNPKKRCAGMKMTHEEWAIKYGFPYCSVKDVDIIKSWVNEEKRNG